MGEQMYTIIIIVFIGSEHKKEAWNLRGFYKRIPKHGCKIAERQWGGGQKGLLADEWLKVCCTNLVNLQSLESNEMSSYFKEKHYQVSLCEYVYY